MPKVSLATALRKMVNTSTHNKISTKDNDCFTDKKTRALSSLQTLRFIRLESKFLRNFDSAMKLNQVYIATHTQKIYACRLDLGMLNL